ncbi:MAG: cytochrome c [Edaphobacter sp.]
MTAVFLTMNNYRKLFSFLGKRCKAPAQFLIALCFVLFVIALLCGLPRRSTPVVQAYSSESKKSGAALFHEKGCEHCHGVNGQGGELGPDLSVVGKRLSKAQIEHQIHDGGAAMPAFSDVLQPDEITDLVDFLHAKRKAPKKTAHPAETATP